jgi:pimeloyl-ACP methyl ester carboxylesterase
VADWLIVLCSLALTLVGLLAFAVVGSHYYYRYKFLDQVIRIFQEKPLFVRPRGEIVPEAENVDFKTPDGLTLRGAYLPGLGKRRGVILFNPEFGSNRWASELYCAKLRETGYDVFTYEPRNQGESDTDPGYAPLQWITDKDLTDARAALAYLKSRPDVDPRGLGIFGISKGGGLAMFLAAEDRSVKCVITDGAYGTYLTVVPFMRRFVSIYSPHKRIQAIAPDALYGAIGMAAIRKVAKARQVRFQWVESAAKRISVPVLMIHGEADSYIKPEMAEALFRRVGAPEKEFWAVPGAKHNQALHVAPADYARRIVDFFDDHLGDIPESRVALPRPSLVEETAAVVKDVKITTGR